MIKSICLLSLLAFFSQLNMGFQQPTLHCFNPQERHYAETERYLVVGIENTHTEGVGNVIIGLPGKLPLMIENFH